MFKVCIYCVITGIISVPDNNLPYLTFEKHQGYVSLSAPTRKAAFLWDQYTAMQLGTAVTEGGC